MSRYLYLRWSSLSQSSRLATFSTTNFVTRRLYSSHIVARRLCLKRPIYKTTFSQHFSRTQSQLQTRPSQTRQLTTLPKCSESITTVQDRLKLFEYDRESFSDAVKGRKVPHELGFPEMQACIVRGIRYHRGFGEELRGSHALFDRALNARQIMSDEIPEMHESERVPYCIWYPEVAREETYRELARRYPVMRYQVGRACAVGGYVDLYRELELLPEVAIAEEARDNEVVNRKVNEGSKMIFEEIMAASTRYAIMNDYERTVRDEKTAMPGALLNADTAVRSSLEWKRKYNIGSSREEWPHPRSEYTIPDYSKYSFTPELSSETYWNITEDWNFDDTASGNRMNYDETETDPRTALFYSPLLNNLPNINKDMLILEAAWAGNIDRYARLRRPEPVNLDEYRCVVRGIHYNTAFAKWWSMQPEIIKENLEYTHSHQEEIRAINARYIMNNNLSRITPQMEKDHLPYLIYWPNVALKETYAELFRRQPCMKLQIARACIIGDYEDLYRSLDVEADGCLLDEGRTSPNLFYAKDQEEKGAADVYDDSSREEWKQHTIAELLKFNSYKLDLVLDDKLQEHPLYREFPIGSQQAGVWEGWDTDMDYVYGLIGNSKDEVYVERTPRR